MHGTPEDTVNSGYACAPTRSKRGNPLKDLMVNSSKGPAGSLAPNSMHPPATARATKWHHLWCAAPPEGSNTPGDELPT